MYFMLISLHVRYIREKEGNKIEKKSKEKKTYNKSENLYLLYNFFFLFSYKIIKNGIFCTTGKSSVLFGDGKNNIVNSTKEKKWITYAKKSIGFT